jgi:phospholipid N-methyltransferase
MLTEKKQTELDFYSPLQSLYAQYRSEKEQLIKITETLDNSVLHYFFDAARANDYRVSVNAADIFKLEPAIKAIDAKYWQTAMMLTDVLECMPADKHNGWHDQIRRHKTPEFTIDNVKATLQEMLRNRDMLLAERVDGIFRKLSHEHVTNCPQGFGKRFIMGYMRSYASVAYEKSNYIHDLRCVIAKFMGRSGVQSHNTWADLNNIKLDGQWNYLDGGAIKIRMYKKGTAHMEVHPEMAYRLNQTLAFLHPHAISAEFRTPPKKKTKEHRLNYDLLGFDVLSDLEGFVSMHGASNWRFNDKLKNKKSELVVEYIGGVKVGSNEWAFDYDPKSILREISRDGCVPEYKSHQYYPTPEHIARDGVAMAGIKDGDFVLEPSAGQGAIAEQIREAHPAASLQCVEISKLHCEILKQKGFEVINADFLKFNPERKCDKIVMNPPFSAGRAADHVKHAFDMLSDDGVLVSILPASFLGKEIIPGSEYSYSHVYKNEFSGCSVNVVIVRICK